MKNDNELLEAAAAAMGYGFVRSYQGGAKFDQGKTRYDLIPVDALEDLARVYTMGANKYADENWRKGISYKRIYGAIQRHLNSYWGGTDIDAESGLPHLAHAAWGIFTLLNYARTHPELDDRVKQPKVEVASER